MRRPDLAKRRWLDRAVIRARWMLRDGLTTPDRAAVDGMTAVQVDASSGLGHGCGLATIRAAVQNWDAWTAEVAARIGGSHG